MTKRLKSYNAELSIKIKRLKSYNEEVSIIAAHMDGRNC